MGLSVLDPTHRARIPVSDRQPSLSTALSPPSAPHFR